MKAADQAGIAACVLGLVIGLVMVWCAKKTADDIRWTAAFFFPIPIVFIGAALIVWWFQP